MMSLLAFPQHRLCFAILSAAALVTSFGETANAQLKPTIQKIDRTQITRNEPIRGINDFPYWVSRADCLADDELTFRVQVTTPSVDNFEVWAGAADCTQLTQRQGNQATCWRVYSGPLTRSPADITISARDLVAQNGPANGETGVPGTKEDCYSDKYIKLGLYFMYINDAGAVSSNTVQFSDAGIDMQGPFAPNVDAVRASDKRLLVDWQNTNPGEFAGYRFYCTEVSETAEVASALTLADGAVVDGSAAADTSTAGDPLGNTEPGTTANLDTATNVGTGEVRDAAAGGSPTPADAGLGDGGGIADGGTTTPTGCGGSVLVEGELPPSSKVCGTVSTFSATSGYTKALVNGRTYAVGMTAVDRLGNESGLSNVLCASPREVYTFFEDYRSSGGQGGGGFCAVSARGKSSSSGWAAWGLVVFGLCLGLFRRINKS